MKPEIVIKDWLMAWLKPEIKSIFRINPGQKLTQDNFPAFINQFKDDTGKQSQYSDDEIEVLKRLILKPLKFSTGYPLNDRETIQQGTIYVFEGGWQQLTKHIGANYWDGKATTSITITGRSSGDGDDLNMAEPSIMLTMMTSLLFAGWGRFIAYHMTDPTINETLYAADEANSRNFGIAMRTLSMSYDAHRYGVITQWKNQ